MLWQWHYNTDKLYTYFKYFPIINKVLYIHSLLLGPNSKPQYATKIQKPFFLCWVFGTIQ